MSTTYTVTLDTSAVIDVLDSKGSCHAVRQILECHRQGRIRLYFSSRVLHPDTQQMSQDKQTSLQRLMEQYGIDIASSSFRLSVSTLNGPDVLDAPSSKRTSDEMNHFKTIVGDDPTQLAKSSAGNRIMQKIGDYDALRDHYAYKRDYFITLDTHDYFHIIKRPVYEKVLGLKIISPEEFVILVER